MNIRVSVSQMFQGQHQQVKARCPGCRQRGTFDTLSLQDVRLNNTELYAGVRRCPDPTCHQLLFFVLENGLLQQTYPVETIDFDPTNIPSAVQGAIEEAIKCHSQGCYIAAAIMVRKTLEELCRDKGAAGGNLKERIKVLGKTVVLPNELLEGLDDLRLLGNDAAHIESQEY